jgi:hypothetical protein
MSSRYFKQFTLTPDVRSIRLAGTISLNSSAAVTGFDIPFVESVEKTGTGEYTITLQDRYVTLRSVQLSVMGADAAVSAKPVSEDVNGAKTIVINTVDTGAAADVTVAATILIDVALKDSSVPS